MQSQQLTRYGQHAGFIVVALTMVEMFAIASQYFILGSFVATICMICVAVMLTKFSELIRPNIRTVSIGVTSAVILYFIFYAGNIAIRSLNLSGLQPSSETSIYSLFATTPVFLRVIIFFLDAVGFESYFRGNLQTRMMTRIGIGSPFVVALVDAAIHISSLNPLFVVTTFIADSVWGLTYYYTKDLYSSFASHFLWDVLIFILLPVN